LSRNSLYEIKYITGTSEGNSMSWGCSRSGCCAAVGQTHSCGFHFLVGLGFHLSQTFTVQGAKQEHGAELLWRKL